MNMLAPDPSEVDAVPQELHAHMGRAAVEGIPVAAIARIFLQDLGETYVVLNYLHSIGTIVEVPKSDWPPTARRLDRVPQFETRTPNIDVQFIAQRVFKLTKLEAGFLTAMIRCDHADKNMLHGIIEQQRMQRQQRPSTTETTDIKMVDVMICKLRKKMKDFDARFASCIKTVWSGGYYIDPTVKPDILAVLSEHGVSDAKAAATQATANALRDAAR